MEAVEDTRLYRACRDRCRYVGRRDCLISLAKFRRALTEIYPELIESEIKQLLRDIPVVDGFIQYSHAIQLLYLE